MFKALSGIAVLGMALTGTAFAQSSVAVTSVTSQLGTLTGGYIQMHGNVIVNTTASKTFLYTIGGNVGINGGNYSAAGDSPFIYRAEVTSTATLSNWTTCTLQLPTVAAGEPGWAYITRSVVAYNGRIYIPGGNNNGAPAERNTITVLEPDANTGDITAVSPLTTTTLTATYADRLEDTSVLNPATGRVYLLGGRSSGTANETSVKSFVINPTTGAIGPLSIVGTLALGVRQAPAVIIGNRLHVIGGAGALSTVATSVTQSATINGDGTLTTFTVNALTLPGNRFDGGAVVYNGSVYVVGGTSDASSTANGNAATQFQIFRGTIDGSNNISAWTTDNSLPYGSRRVTVVSDGRAVFLVGGRITASSLTAVTLALVPFVPSAAAQAWNLFE